MKTLPGRLFVPRAGALTPAVIATCAALVVAAPGVARADRCGQARVESATGAFAGMARCSLGQGDPAARLFVTHNFSAGTGVLLRDSPVLRYLDGAWWIGTANRARFPAGTVFNVYQPGPEALGGQLRWREGNRAYLTEPELVTAVAGGSKALLVSAGFSEAAGGGALTLADGARTYSVRTSSALAIGRSAPVNYCVTNGFVHVAQPANISVSMTRLPYRNGNLYLQAGLFAGADQPVPATGVGVSYFNGAWHVFQQSGEPIAPGTRFMVSAFSIDGRPVAPDEAPPAPSPVTGLTLAPPIIPPLVLIPGTPASSAPAQPPGTVPATPPIATPVQRFRVVLNGFTVEQETDDDILERDGRGDEIYFVTRSFVLEPPGANGLSRVTFDSGCWKSAVYGDPNGRPDRVQAGSRAPGPLSGGVRGGLRTGDNVPELPWRRFAEPQQRRLPLKLWEGALTGGANAPCLVVLPTVWEWDGEAVELSDRERLNEISNGRQLWRERPPGVAPAAGRSNTLPLDTLRFVEVFGNFPGSPGGTYRRQGFDKPKAGEGPIGTYYANLGGGFMAKGLSMNGDTAAWLAATDFGNGPGVLRLSYGEVKGEMKGKYLLYIQVEKLP